MKAIFWKEVKSYFYSPVAYVLIGLFMLMISIFFLGNLYGQSADFNIILDTMGFVFIFIMPILTMRILAEDKKNGTEVLLVTSPTSIAGIVIGKYLASLFVFLVLTCITFIYPIILFIFGGKLTAQLIGGYIGFILLGAACISVGIFASSLTENQIVAAIIGFVSLLIIWVSDGLGAMLGGVWADILGWFSLFSRYTDFNRGILGLSPIVYYLSFISVFIFLTIQVIEKRRWSQG